MLFMIIIFLILSFFHIFCIYVNKKKGIIFTKPLLIPTLLLFYIFYSPYQHYCIIIALFCGFLGDVFLMWTKKQSCVLIGLIFFLIGHIFYIITFIQNIYYFPIYSLIFSIPYILFIILILKNIILYMKEMMIPGIIYLSVIVVMSYFAFLRFRNVSFTSFILPFLGSILFIVSDTILSYDLFIKQKKHHKIYVMTTYLLAQFLIIYGFMI